MTVLPSAASGCLVCACIGSTALACVGSNQEGGICYLHFLVESTIGGRSLPDAANPQVQDTAGANDS